MIDSRVILVKLYLVLNFPWGVYMILPWQTIVDGGSKWLSMRWVLISQDEIIRKSMNNPVSINDAFDADIFCVDTCSNL